MIERTAPSGHVGKSNQHTAASGAYLTLSKAKGFVSHRTLTRILRGRQSRINAELVNRIPQSFFKDIIGKVFFKLGDPKHSWFLSAYFIVAEC
ncbi:MAG: hypothetical protein G3H99_07455 [Ferrovum sp.]|nr:hypothetical protein [Ferrovum sp.]NDU87687.1 hypothetical protein [Ferrovum sp.]